MRCDVVSAGVARAEVARGYTSVSKRHGKRSPEILGDDVALKPPTIIGPARSSSMQDLRECRTSHTTWYRLLPSQSEVVFELTKFRIRSMDCCCKADGRLSATRFNLADNYTDSASITAAGVPTLRSTPLARPYTS
jgi:hypothetical protein